MEAEVSSDTASGAEAADTSVLVCNTLLKTFYFIREKGNGMALAMTFRGRGLRPVGATSVLGRLTSAAHFDSMSSSKPARYSTETPVADEMALNLSIYYTPSLNSLVLRKMSVWNIMVRNSCTSTGSLLTASGT